jgi:hypothetical protein
MHSEQSISSFLHFINEPSITPGSYEYVSQKGLISWKIFSVIVISSYIDFFTLGFNDSWYICSSLTVAYIVSKIFICLMYLTIIVVNY